MLRLTIKKKEQPKSISELLGIALGCIGLSFDDFCKLDFDEFAAVWESYAARRDAQSREAWSIARVQAFFSVQPYLKKGTKITPQKLLPLPWDGSATEDSNEDIKLTAEQQRERMRELVNSLGDELI